MKNYQAFSSVTNFLQTFKLIYKELGSPNFSVTRNIWHRKPPIKSGIKIISFRKFLHIPALNFQFIGLAFLNCFPKMHVTKQINILYFLVPNGIAASFWSYREKLLPRAFNYHIWGSQKHPPWGAPKHPTLE